MIGISPWAIRSYVRQKKLPAVRVGSRVLFSMDALQRVLTEGLR